MHRIFALSDDLAAHRGSLARSESLHSMLRPEVLKPYGNTRRRMFAEGGLMAVLAEGAAHRR